MHHWLRFTIRICTNVHISDWSIHVTFRWLLHVMLLVIRYNALILLRKPQKGWKKFQSQHDRSFVWHRIVDEGIGGFQLYLWFSDIISYHVLSPCDVLLPLASSSTCKKFHLLASLLKSHRWNDRLASR